MAAVGDLTVTARLSEETLAMIAKPQRLALRPHFAWGIPFLALASPLRVVSFVSEFGRADGEEEIEAPRASALARPASG